jgi:hypothetical protein
MPNQFLKKVIYGLSLFCVLAWVGVVIEAHRASVTEQKLASLKQAFDADHNAGARCLVALNDQTDLMRQFGSFLDDLDLLDCPSVNNTVLRHDLEMRLGLAKAKGERDALGVRRK